MLSSRWLLGGPRPLALFLLALGCSGTDVGYPRVSESATCPDIFTPPPEGGSSPSGSAGTSGNTSGMPSAAGNSAAGGGGSGGVSPGGGSGGNAGMPAAAGAGSIAGGPATGPFQWPGAFEAGMSPTPADGHHNAGAGCMSSSCHGTKVPFLFGGTVYKADGTTGAPNVQVGISDGTLTVTAYSASNGNIWLPSSAGQLNFATAQIAIRNANGERVKPATAGRGAACNGGGCHGSAMRLLEP